MPEMQERKEMKGLSLNDIPCALHGRVYDSSIGKAYCKFSPKIFCPARVISENSRKPNLCNYVES